MKKLLIIIFFILISLTSLTHSYAYWSSSVNGAETNTWTQILIGSWLSDIIIPDDWNLNIWEDEDDINHIIPEGQLFTYDTHIYISLGGYNPEYHGLPGEPNLLWAFVSTELEWRPNTNYRVNSVVVRDGRYFIANILFNTSDWFINDPLTNSGHSWSEWREIEPISESYFNTFQGTNLIDYATPDFNFVIYK